MMKRQPVGLSDPDIRSTLRADVARSIGPDDLLLNELQMRDFDAIIDVAVVGRLLCGFEIKSDRDSLARLERQVSHYDRVFDMCTLVTTDRHAAKAEWRIPDAWGIISARRSGSHILFETRRDPQLNSQVSAYHTLYLLRRDEIIDILRANVRRKPWAGYDKEALIQESLRYVGESDARSLALEVLRTRRTWTLRQLDASDDSERIRLATRWPLPNLSLALPLL